MLRYDRRARLLAACFSGVAGYVDAIGFLLTGGFFVSFMSGNSTRLGIGLAEGSSQAVFAAVLLVAFVVGVMLGAVTGRIAGRHRQAAVLGLVTVLLATAVLLHSLGAGVLVALPMALAMGAENTVFAEDGGGSDRPDLYDGDPGQAGKTSDLRTDGRRSLELVAVPAALVRAGGGRCRGGVGLSRIRGPCAGGRRGAHGCDDRRHSRDRADVGTRRPVVLKGIRSDLPAPHPSPRWHLPARPPR